MQTGIGRHYREPSWLERLASGSAGRAPAWLRAPLKRAYGRLLSALPGNHLTCRLPGWETIRVDPDYRHLAWNAEEYAALKRHTREGATILDIGANVGCYTLLFARWVGDSGHVYAFEPAAASRAGLERHLSLNGLAARVTVRPEAITDRSGSAPFIDAGTHGDNRLVPAATTGTTSVPALSIDEFCESAGLSPEVIKIDIEGAELAALRGARRTIARRGPALALFVELHPAIWPSLGVTRADIEAELLHQHLVVEPPPGVDDVWALEGICVRLSARLMRILIANEALSGGGGVETYLATIVPALQAAGHDVGILHDNPVAEAGPQRIAPEGTWRTGVHDEGLHAAVDRVREFAPDVCFSHNMRTLAVDAQLLVEWPVVKMMHGHFGTCVSGQKAFGFPKVVACTRPFGPGCLVHYLPHRCGQANPFVMAQEYQWGTEQRSLFDRYRAVVVASRFMRDEYLRAGMAPAGVHAIPLFAPPRSAEPEPGEETRPIDVVFLGRMTALKGPDILVEAAAHASAKIGRPLVVVFAGEGPERDHLRALSAARGLDARFPGWLTPPERDQLLRDTSIIAVPSRWAEPFGLVGLEGAVFGTPAVAFDAGGIADWLTDRENGRLIGPTRGAAGLGDAIAGILQSPKLRRELSLGARAAAARFSLQNHLSMLLAVLEQAAATDVPALLITWHLITQEYPPACGGVGDYTALLAGGLADAGDRVHVWHPTGAGDSAAAAPGAGVIVRQLPDRFGQASRAVLAAALIADPGVVVVQYVPGAFGARGLNVPFCRWLARIRRAGADVRVMFHEPFFYFGIARPWRNALAVVQRAMAAILLRAATRVYYSTETWKRLLAPYGPQDGVEVLPIPSTVPADPSAGAIARARSRRRGGFVIGHFGTYGDHVGRELSDILPALMHRLPDARVLLVGGGGEAFAGTLPSETRDRVDATGRLPAEDVGAALRACDLIMQPYPDGVTTRRTSAMAALTTSVPLLTSAGPLTEPVWAQTSAAALAPAGDRDAFIETAVRLAADPGARADLGARGRALYDGQFALGVTIARMRR